MTTAPAPAPIEVMRVARRAPNGRLAMYEKTSPAGKAHLDADERRAQATLMLMRRLFGRATLAEIADEFGVSPVTVQKRLSSARLDGVPEEARDIFIREMLPQSMAVLQEALTCGDLKIAVQVALKVVDGLKVLEDAQSALAAGTTEETLETWKARLTIRRPGPADTVQSEPAGYIDLGPTPTAASAETRGPEEGSTGSAPTVCVRGPEGGAASPAQPEDPPPAGQRPGEGIVS